MTAGVVPVVPSVAGPGVACLRPVLPGPGVVGRGLLLTYLSVAAAAAVLAGAGLAVAGWPPSPPGLAYAELLRGWTEWWEAVAPTTVVLVPLLLGCPTLEWLALAAGCGTRWAVLCLAADTTFTAGCAPVLPLGRDALDHPLYFGCPTPEVAACPPCRWLCGVLYEAVSRLHAGGRRQLSSSPAHLRAFVTAAREYWFPHQPDSFAAAHEEDSVPLAAVEFSAASLGASIVTGRLLPELVGTHRPVCPLPDLGPPYRLDEMGHWCLPWASEQRPEQRVVTDLSRGSPRDHWLLKTVLGIWTSGWLEVGEVAASALVFVVVGAKWRMCFSPAEVNALLLPTTVSYGTVLALLVAAAQSGVKVDVKDAFPTVVIAERDRRYLGLVIRLPGGAVLTLRWRALWFGLNHGPQVFVALFRAVLRRAPPLVIPSRATCDYMDDWIRSATAADAATVGLSMLLTLMAAGLWTSAPKCFLRWPAAPLKALGVLVDNARGAVRVAPSSAARAVLLLAADPDGGRSEPAVGTVVSREWEAALSSFLGKLAWFSVALPLIKAFRVALTTMLPRPAPAPRPVWTEAARDELIFWRSFGPTLPDYHHELLPRPPFLLVVYDASDATSGGAWVALYPGHEALRPVYADLTVDFDPQQLTSSTAFEAACLVSVLRLVDGWGPPWLGYLSVIPVGDNRGVFAGLRKGGATRSLSVAGVYRELWCTLRRPSGVMASLMALWHSRWVPAAKAADALSDAARGVMALAPVAVRSLQEVTGCARFDHDLCAASAARALSDHWSFPGGDADRSGELRAALRAAGATGSPSLPSMVDVAGKRLFVFLQAPFRPWLPWLAGAAGAAGSLTVAWVDWAGGSPEARWVDAQPAPGRAWSVPLGVSPVILRDGSRPSRFAEADHLRLAHWGPAEVRAFRRDAPAERVVATSGEARNPGPSGRRRAVAVRQPEGGSHRCTVTVDAHGVVHRDSPASPTAEVPLHTGPAGSVVADRVAGQKRPRPAVVWSVMRCRGCDLEIAPAADCRFCDVSDGSADGETHFPVCRACAPATLDRTAMRCPRHQLRPPSLPPVDAALEASGPGTVGRAVARLRALAAGRRPTELLAFPLMAAAGGAVEALAAWPAALAAVHAATAPVWTTDRAARLSGPASRLATLMSALDVAAAPVTAGLDALSVAYVARRLDDPMPGWRTVEAPSTVAEELSRVAAAIREDSMPLLPPYCSVIARAVLAARGAFERRDHTRRVPVTPAMVWALRTVITPRERAAWVRAVWSVAWGWRGGFADRVAKGHFTRVGGGYLMRWSLRLKRRRGDRARPDSEPGVHPWYAAVAGDALDATWADLADGPRAFTASAAEVTALLRKYLPPVPPGFADYDSHSLRAGLDTALQALLLPTDAIAALMGWARLRHSAGYYASTSLGVLFAAGRLSWLVRIKPVAPGLYLPLEVPPAPVWSAIPTVAQPLAAWPAAGPEGGVEAETEDEERPREVDAVRAAMAQRAVLGEAATGGAPRARSKTVGGR